MKFNDGVKQFPNTIPKSIIKICNTYLQMMNIKNKNKLFMMKLCYDFAVITIYSFFLKGVFYEIIAAGVVLGDRCVHIVWLCESCYRPEVRQT